MVYDITLELSKQGHDVEVWTSDAHNLRSRVKSVDTSTFRAGAKVRYFKNLSFALIRLLNIHITPGIFLCANRKINSFDVVHLHGARTLLNLAVYPYLKRYSVPFFLQSHGSLPRTITKQGLKLFYDLLFGHRILRDASRVIALSEVEAQQYRIMGVPDEKIAVIPNGIDFSEYTILPSKGSFKRKFGIKKDKKIILYLGRIHKSKGIDLLVKAYSHLINDMNFKDTILVVAGPDDGFLAEATVLVSSLGISDSVIFTGFISSENKLKVLVDADVFVTPSFNGFPITFLEACATGTPIITTTLGDTLEWINGNVGYVTPPKHRDLAQAIHTIISDDELHRKFSTNCLKIVREEFSLEKVVNKLEKLYEVSERASNLRVRTMKSSI